MGHILMNGTLTWWLDSHIDALGSLFFFYRQWQIELRKCQNRGHTFFIQVVYKKSQTKPQKRKKKPRGREI